MAVRVRAAADARDAFREAKGGVGHRFDYPFLSFVCCFVIK
jgi:hypothetical protein